MGKPSSYSLTRDEKEAKQMKADRRKREGRHERKWRMKGERGGGGGGEGEGEKETERKRWRRGKKMHYCRPDGSIPHDQTNQSGSRGRRCSTHTYTHTHTHTHHFTVYRPQTHRHQSMAPPRTCEGGGGLRVGASPEPGCFTADDFIITHTHTHTHHTCLQGEMFPIPPPLLSL